MGKKIAVAGDRTRIALVTGANTHRYTVKTLLLLNLMSLL